MQCCFSDRTLRDSDCQSFPASISIYLSIYLYLPGGAGLVELRPQFGSRASPALRPRLEGRTRAVMAGMTLAELDAALRAAMDDDWDGPSSASGGNAAAPGRTAAVPEHAAAAAAAAPGCDAPPVLLDESAALDAALRAAMDGDWEGRAGAGQLAAAALPALAADAASRCPRSMGYMALEGSAAAALMPGGADMGATDPSAGAGDACYILPRLDDEPFMLPTLSDAQQREQMEEIQRALAARSGSDPAEL